MREGFPKIHDTLRTHEEVSKRDVEDTGDFDMDEQERLHGPHIDIDFEKLYQTKHDLEDQLDSNSPDLNAKLEGKIDNLTEEELDKLFVEVLFRIQDETNYFHELEEMGVFENVLDHELGNNFGLKKVGGVRIKWKSWMPQSEGLYMEGLRTAFIRGEKPTREQILKKIVQKGRLPGGLRIVLHEIIHSYQFNTSIIDRYKIIAQGGSLNDGEELREVQAYKNEGNSKKGSTKRGLVEKIYNAKDKKDNYLYPGVNMDKLIYAAEVIDQLDALDFLPQEIGKIIQTEMIPNKQGYARSVIAQKMLDLGLDENDLENLVQADKVERQIARLQAMKIVQEELEKIK